ncbi:hypothetical protein ACS0TY_029226 [Phlomoides rotata]
MASKGRVPPPHHRHPLPGPGVVHPDPYAAIRPPHGAFPPYEMLPPHEVLAHKLSAQHVEIEKLATENQRLAATHGTLRQDLATSKHELQLVHAHIAEVKSDKEQQLRGIMDKMSKMEPELEAAESIKMELQQARAEAHAFVAARQELISKVQQLTRDLQMSHSEAQQIPPLMTELDSLRQEYHRCRGTYEYEKKLYNDHLESLQVMEKNYMAMSREVEKLRAELSNATNFDPRTGGPYGGYGGYNKSVSMGNYASAQAYSAGQVQGPHLGGSSGGAPAGAAGTEGGSPHVLTQPAPYGAGTARDASRGPMYPAFRGTSYDPHKGHLGAGYETQRVQAGASYDAQRGPTGPGGPTPSSHNAPTGLGYEAQSTQKGPGFEVQRTTPGFYDGQSAPVYDMQRGSGDDVQREKSIAYDASSRGTVGSQGQVAATNNLPYQPTPNTRAGNPAHR